MNKPQSETTEMMFLQRFNVIQGNVFYDGKTVNQYNVTDSFNVFWSVFLFFSCSAVSFISQTDRAAQRGRRKKRNHSDPLLTEKIKIFLPLSNDGASKNKFTVV